MGYFCKPLDAFICLCWLFLWFNSACLPGPKSEGFHPVTWSNLTPWESYGQTAWPNPIPTSSGFFSFLRWNRWFRARLEHPAPSWTALYGPAGSSCPTWCARAAPGLCQRFRFTSHPQVFISGAACGPLFADPAANPGEKSGALYALARCITGQWCTFETASDWLQADKTISEILSKKGPNLTHHRSRWVLQIAQTVFEKDGHWERKHSLATYPGQTGSAATTPAQGVGTLAVRLLPYHSGPKKCRKTMPNSSLE